jgi:hypothetical protein
MQETQQPKPKKPARYSWAEVWTAVLTKPNVATFSEILNDPQATLQRALIWVYLGGLAASGALMISLISDPALIEMFSQSPEFAGMDVEAALRGSLLLAVPIASLFALAIFAGLIAIMHFLARQLTPGSDAKYSELAYTIGAIFAPINIISIFLLLIPFLGILGIVLNLYQLYLMWLAVRAVYGIEGRNAAIVVAVPMIGAMLLPLLLL